MASTLSGLDATFLYLETPDMPMHVASVCVYQLPEGYQGDFTRALRAHIAARMHLAPLFSNRLGWPPLNLGHPVWLHTPKVDLTQHIRKLRLPKPGGAAELEAACADLHAQLLDRGAPLWQFVVIEGLARTPDQPAGCKRVALYAKIHHAALDGQGGTVLANAILDLSPVPRPVPPPAAGAKPARAADLKIGRLIGAVFSNSLAQYAKIVRALPESAQALGKTVLGGLRSGSAGAPAKLPLGLAPRTPFNVAIGPRRVFARASLDQQALRLAARTLGDGTLNDALLFVCGTALAAFLQRRGALPKGKSLVAAMPVSLREAGNRDLNNQASMTLVELGTQHATAQARWNAIRTSTGKVKDALAQLKSVLPTDYPSLLAPWLVGGLRRLYTGGKLGQRLPPLANVVISNVPGPKVPLYLAGARMMSFHPLSIVVHGMALNITVQSYDGRLDVGLIGCAKALPDLRELARDIEAAAGALLLLAKTAPSAQTVPTAPSAETSASRAGRTKPGDRAAAPRRRPGTQATARATTKAAAKRESNKTAADAPSGSTAKATPRRKRTAHSAPATQDDRMA